MRRFIAVAVAFFAIAAPARADFSVTPSTTQAAAPADVTIDASFASTPSSVALHLPPGLVGNPSAATRCSIADFTAGTCAGSSEVGTASATGTLVLVVLPVPVTATGTVYNLAPAAGEPARLGIDVQTAGIHVRNQASVSLRPDGGLDSTITSLDKGPLTTLDGLSLTLSHTFMTMPTSCLPATTTIEVPPNAPASATFTPTGCDTVPFTPSVSASLDTTQRVVPSGATVSLNLPSGQSHVRRAEIVLPEGTTLSPGVANGLQACTADQFASDTGCPDGSQIGTVSFVTPLLGTLGGKVYFGDGFALYIVVSGDGVLVKLPGQVQLNPANGQITTVFDNLPQVPFTSFSLSFQGGSHAVLANPAACGEKTVSAALTPWSGTATKTATATFTIDADGHGGACTEAAFAPGLSVAADSTAAGRPAGAVTLSVSRPDGSPDIARVTTVLPPGLAGSLKGVPVCPEANANAGTCPASTQVGVVDAQAGSGDAPVVLTGTVSLTGPYDGGLAGLAIALPGKVGPVDLGTVVVRASIVLRPDGGLNVRTSTLPQFVGGVPVSIRQLSLILNRPGFILNSSSCAPQQVAAVLDATNGNEATVTAPYQASDCAGLRFGPQLDATVGARGKTGKGASAPLHAVITVPNGQSSTATADVGLPSAIVIDARKLTSFCPAPQLAANACPAKSQIGSAVATTPLLDGALTSPVYLASKGSGLPGLALNLTGPVTLPLFGNVALPGADKRIHNTFSGIPDVPLARFDLTFTSASPLVLSRDVCHGPRQTVTGALTGHNGTVTRLTTPLKVAGCPPVATLSRRGHKLSIRLTRGRDEAVLKSAKLTLPGAKARTVKTKQTLTLKRLPGRKQTVRLVVKDASGASWTLKQRVIVRR